MKTSILNCAPFILFLAFSSPLYGQNFEWASSIGGNNDDSAEEMAIDPSGNILLAGTFKGTVDLDPGPAVSNHQSMGNEDTYLIKLDPVNGQLKWAITFGAKGWGRLENIETDSEGNILIAGFKGANSFIAKVDSAGTVIWQKEMSGDGDIDELTTDSMGNIYFGGAFEGTISFPAVAGVSLTSFGGLDLLAGKMNSNGDVLWLKQFGGSGFGGVRSVASDAVGNLYVLSEFLYTLDFDPSPTSQLSFTASAIDIALVKLDSSGDFRWARHLGGPSDEQASEVKLDRKGKVYVLGTFISHIDFNIGLASARLNGTTWGVYDVFVAKYDTSGNYFWSNRIAGDDFDYATDMSLDHVGDVYICGFTDGDISFPGIDTTYLFSGGHDAFMGKISSSGNWLWSGTIQGTGDERLLEIAVDSSGAIYATGKFQGQADFDPTNGVQQLVSTNNWNGFILKLGQPGLSLNNDGPGVSISVFPNPSAGNFFLEAPLGNVQEINVYTASGKKIFTKPCLHESLIEINIDASAGIYFVEIKSPEAQPTLLKLLKK